MSKTTGLNKCPYCGGIEILVGTNKWTNEEGDDRIHQTCECEECDRSWVIEYRPVQYYVYPPVKLDPTPISLIEGV